MMELRDESKFLSGPRQRPEKVIPPEMWLDEAERSNRPLEQVWSVQLKSHQSMMIAMLKTMAKTSASAFWREKCAYCRKPFCDDLTLDHVEPQCFGGSDELSNLIAACAKCNSSRNELPCVEYLKRLGKTDAEREWFFRSLAQWQRACAEACQMSTEEKYARHRKLEADGLFEPVFNRFGYESQHYLG